MPIPRDAPPDSTLALLREGYPFIASRARALGSDLFRARLMLTPAVCMTGAEAAAAFYAPDAFTRRGAMPQASFTLIQDNGSVMTLDGAAHRRRKAMFLAMMAPEAVRRLGEGTARHLRARLAGRAEAGLYEEAHLALTLAVAEWAGLPLGEEEGRARAREFEAMVDGTGSVGPRNWRGHLLRARAERWARGVIEAVRAGRREAPEGSPLRAVAEFRDEEGELLSPKIAGVEWINVLRPTVANARYVAFAAMALHQFPAAREAVAGGGDDEAEAFAHEVRRFYPFIPFIGGKALRAVEVGGHAFAPRDWVLMDLWGTNHDPRLWAAPEAFRPERFLRPAPRLGPAADASPIVSHGTGDRAAGHRCPGEWITVEQIKAAAVLLARDLAYRVPEQDLTLDLARMPARPRGALVLEEVREK